MADRAGEKLGWTGGWLGGFLWVLLLSIIFVVQGRVTPGVLGLLLVAAAVLLVLVGAPWRHPDTPYWKLMSPVYLAFFAALGWACWSSGGVQELGLSGWSALLLLPLMIPFWTVGRRRWNDTAPGETPGAPHTALSNVDTPGRDGRPGPSP